MIFNINRIWVYLIYLLVGFGIIGGIVYHLKEIGRQEEIIEQYKEKEKQFDLLLKENQKLTSKVSQLQRSLNDASHKINVQTKQLKEKKAREANTVLANHLNGTDRLSIPVLYDKPVTTTRTGNTRDTSGPPGTRRYELHPATAQTIVDLTKRADKITAERNQCIDLLKETQRRVEEYNEIILKRK